MAYNTLTNTFFNPYKNTSRTKAAARSKQVLFHSIEVKQKKHRQFFNSYELIKQSINLILVLCFY